jgi:hypothetical protein
MRHLLLSLSGIVIYLKENVYKCSPSTSPTEVSLNTDLVLGTRRDGHKCFEMFRIQGALQWPVRTALECWLHWGCQEFLSLSQRLLVLIASNRTSILGRINLYYEYMCKVWVEECGSVVGLGTMLQTGRSRDRFLRRSLHFSINLILPAALWPWVDSACNRNEYHESFLGGKGRPARKAHTLTTICLENVGALTSQPYGPLRTFYLFM